ncbi:hypothetical protein G9A89_013097 [Geosiphon pyriformis]|nr:hypothetical protein G9A89_013097 [Geosiphon pyriformis]
MSSTSSIENPTSPLDWLEELLIIIKENLAIFPASEHSEVADLVKKYIVRNQKTPEDLFNCLKNKSSKRSIHHILLGFSLEHGIGTIPNLRRAFLRFQKAANAEDPFGQFFLGRCYYNGVGTSQDLGKAFELYSEAAEAGDTNAQNNLALCYQNGLGTTKNEEKAFELYSRATISSPVAIKSILANKPPTHAGRTFDSLEDQYGPLPAWWERRVNHLGDTYYVDHSTRTTTWTRPSAQRPQEQQNITELERQRHNNRTLPEERPLTTTSTLLNSPSSLSVNAIEPTSTGTPAIKGATTAGYESLSLGWEQRNTFEGRPYFADHNTRSTTWLAPQLGPLPFGWERRLTSTARVYFVDHNTKTTTFDDPRLAEAGNTNA